MANARKIRTNLEAAGTLTIAGASTLAALNAAASTLSSLTVTGASTLTGGVSGNTTFANNVTINGSLVVSGGVTYGGGSNFLDNAFSIQDNGDVTKDLVFQLSGSTTGITTTLATNSTVARQIDLPDATTTLVGTDASQTLTNKSIDADANTITNIDNADIKAAAAIARSKLANGTANAVVINSAGGVLTDEAQLSAVRGGTGADLSAATGVVKIAASVMSASAIVDADIDAAAAIARSKIAAATPNYVLINSGGGLVSEEAQLAASRGGTGNGSYAVGDSLYASGATTISKRAIGSTGQVSKVVAGIPAWEDPFDPARELILVDDWITDKVGALRWLSIVGGAGATSIASLAYDDSNHHGVVELETGTTATGFSHHGLGGVTTGAFTSGIQLAGGQVIVEFMAQAVQLSTVAQEFALNLGIRQAYTASTDDVMFRYDRLVYGANWQAWSRAASTNTVTDTGIPVVAGQWYKLRFVVNATGTSVDYYIDGVLVATNATNVPTGVNLAPIISMVKSAGTTSVSAAVDYFKLYKRYTTAK